MAIENRTTNRTAKRQQGLQQAASVIFALVAIVPLLIFAWTLHVLDVLDRTQSQIGLSLALSIALLGGWIFRSLLMRMSDVVQSLMSVVEQTTRRRAPSPPTGSPGAASPVAVTPAAVPGAAAPIDDGTSSGIAAPWPAPAAAAQAATAAPLPAAAPVPIAAPQRPLAGMRPIRELDEIERTMAELWSREARACSGQRVQVSVANLSRPLVGVITEVTDDGFILDQDGRTIPIGYRRVIGIETLSTPPVASPPPDAPA